MNEGKSLLSEYALFDSHFHIINKHFPLIPNNGYLPDEFNAQTYLARMGNYKLTGGAIVSGSFQGFDQCYLLDALNQFGTGFVGVTQLPALASDEEIINLDKAGVRALRFNIQRGGSAPIEQLKVMASRVYELVGWHVELYINSVQLRDISALLLTLPKVSIDHLGLSKHGLPDLLKLVEKGMHVKATGFGRGDLDVRQALKDIYSANPYALMFGTDLPSTRAPTPYSDDDFLLLFNVFGHDAAKAILSENALALYQPLKHFGC